MTRQPRVGYVGLGNMGAPMAKCLTAWPGGLTVYDVRPEAMAALVSEGAVAAGGLRDIAACDVISITVLDDAQVRDVVAELTDTAKPETVIAVHSTISDTTAVALAEESAPNGISVIDAPVSGGAVAATKGELATMVGAPRPVYERVKPVFKAWAAMVVHAGEPGAGTRMKLARNMLGFTAYAAVGEALRLAESAGLDLQALGRVVRHTDAITGGPGAVMIRDDAGPLPPEHFLRQIFTHTRELGEKDLALALTLGTANGVDLPLARTALAGLAAALGVPHIESAEETP